MGILASGSRLLRKVFVVLLSLHGRFLKKKIRVPHLQIAPRNGEKLKKRIMYIKEFCKQLAIELRPKQLSMAATARVI